MEHRPTWVDERLFPFDSHFVEIDGANVHYIDEGSGPIFLALHGNPTWSFLYRHIVHGLKDRFRCVALDHPGFGLSTAPPGYGYTPAEHSRVLEGFLEALDLRDITLMVQDWGGPIGFAAAMRHPARFRAFVIGNTWGWPVNGQINYEWFSRLLGSRFAGGFLIKRLDFFTRVFMRTLIRRRSLTAAEWAMYRRPHASPQSRAPVHVLPREILKAREFLAEVEQGLSTLADRPALIVWGDRDPAFRIRERRRWEEVFPEHRTVILKGASHYIQEDASDEIVAAVREWWPDSVEGKA